MFVAKKQKVSLTTDTWTYIQNVCYMSLTAHYVDDDWMLHKRILSFCVIPNHKGEAIGKLIEVYLHDWGIEKVFIITLDNASANNNLIAYLKRKMVHWKSCVLDADFLHIRCSAHIFNLIVCESLKELDDSIASIRNTVRYVRSSPSRLQKFKGCISQEKIDSKTLVCLDVLTRWNSTYLMLESALKFQKVFDRMEEEDGHYASYFGEDDSDRKKVEPPLAWHWDDAKVFVQFLKGFYDVTLKFNASLHVTSNIYFHQISSIQKQLDDLCVSEDDRLCVMARKMREKYNKYWGSMGNVNKLFLIAAVPDPRYKLDYVSFSYVMLYDNDESMVTKLINSLKKTLMRLYNWYNEREMGSDTSCQSSIGVESCGTSLNCNSSGLEHANYADRVWIAYLKKREQNQCKEVKNDVDRYLVDPCKSSLNKGFDILNW
ncbi:zinc finger BED domain-containing protein RICESLEEPER 2-like [Ziziphus jujuba]|uniref:Zinc finger BED domain-containing protein RICESLEEPER 2-like n=1 Tax=Ziziphus jujuba TaxID=326968 RepID=A0ABM4A206_ZIZJJ|nr:zinc finger BED domain-containing protein RICESLEEPER 2-like [Ziziphus jujuba]